jgi:HemY protein
LTQLEIKAYQTLLPKMIEVDKEDGIQRILQFWKQAPHEIQSNTILLAQYCSLLINQGLHSEVEALLRAALKKELDNHLIYLYGLITPNPKKQLVFAESFLNQAPNNPVLLLTLGKLCFATELWGRARDYLEKSVSLKESPETYRELAHVYDKMGFSDKRDQCYKQGLGCATEGSIFLESLVS